MYDFEAQYLAFAKRQIKTVVEPPKAVATRPGVPKLNQKRFRTSFTDYQLRELRAEFEQSSSLEGNRRRRIAEKLGLCPYNVKVWFQNQRQKLKKKAHNTLPVYQPAVATILPSSASIQRDALRNFKPQLTVRLPPQILRRVETCPTSTAPQPQKDVKDELSEFLSFKPETSSQSLHHQPQLQPVNDLPEPAVASCSGANGAYSNDVNTSFTELEYQELAECLGTGVLDEESVNIAELILNTDPYISMDPPATDLNKLDANSIIDDFLSEELRYW